MKWKWPESWRKPNWTVWREMALPLIDRYKYVGLVLLAGLLLLLWPSGKKDVKAQKEPPPVQTGAAEEDFSVAALEEKLSETLSKIHGAGDVSVMLTVQGGSRRVLAQDSKESREADGAYERQSETVVVSAGTGSGEGPVLLQQLYPRFQGAVVVCEGGGDASVRLKLMEAVSALTGLGTDKIAICKGKG